MDDQAKPASGLLKAIGTSPAVVICSTKTAERDDLRQAIALVREQGFDVRIESSGSVEQTSDLIQQYASEQGTTLIAAGGDGMLNVFAQAVDDFDLRGCVFGVLPLGTANDFATAAGIPGTDLVTALRVAIAGEPCTVDMGFINDRPFLNVVTLGRTAAFSNEVEPAMKDRFGKWAYAIAAIKRVGDARCEEVRVQAGDLDWSGPAFAVMVGNGRQAGGGFALSADGMIDDGQLDGLIIPEMTLREAAVLAMDMKNGGVDPRLDDLPVFRAASATVSFPCMQAMQVDGEQGQVHQAQFRVAPGRVRIRLPRVTDVVSWD